MPEWLIYFLMPLQAILFMIVRLLAIEIVMLVLCILHVATAVGAGVFGILFF